MQTRRQTVIEVCTNTGIGMLGSWVITMAVISFVNNTVVAATLTVILCTLWSLGRGYAVRRYFARKHNVNQK